MSIKNFYHKRWRWIATAAAAICLLAALAAWLLTRTSAGVSGYTPYPEDELAMSSAEIDLPTNLPTLDTENYALCLMPVPSVDADGNCGLYLTNPETNDVWLMFDLRLAEDNTLIYRTGLLAPSKTIESLPLSQAAVDLLAASGDAAEATLRVYSFALESYESMGEISISLSVDLSEKGADRNE